MLRACIVLLFLSSVAYAEVYISYDENGNPVYSDEPPKDRESEQIEVPEANTQPAVQVQRRSFRRSELEERERAHSLTVRLIGPADGTQFGPKDEFLSVSAELNESLPPGLLVRFMMNGQAMMPASRNLSTTIQLTIKLRGTKTIHAEIIDAETGEVLTASPAHTVYVIRPGGRR
jgi:hypothetical protein